jgi:hypothetical protein
MFSCPQAQADCGLARSAGISSELENSSALPQALLSIFIARSISRSYILPVELLCLILLSSISMSAQVADVDFGDFDRPEMTVVDFGPSPYYRANSNIRKKLTCYSYPSFMIKEYDEGQKGAEWLSITRFGSENRPECSLSRLSGEQVIRDEDVAYFRGAKDSFAFFNAADGIDGGQTFYVYDTSTGTKVFEDSAFLGATDLPNLAGDIHIDRDNGQRLVLTYLRVIACDCDLTKEVPACWERARSDLGISTNTPPSCFRYEGINENLPSAVAYPVSVVLSDHPQD